MDKLNAKQQEEVKRMSTERLVIKLTKVGYDEETLASMDRGALMAAFAEHLLKPSSVVAVSLGDLELRKLELKMRERELEAKEAREKKEAEERERDREERIKREEKEDVWREKELLIREAEFKRQEKRDEEEEMRRRTLTGQTKYFGGALKHALPRMSNDPIELPGYFKAVENLFDLYEVPESVRSKLLIPLLSDKAKTLISRLSKASLDKYKDVRDFILREFRLSAEQYRDKFNTYIKPPEDTYTLYSSRLRNFFMYYLDSRKVTTKEEIIDLLLADRIKQTLPDHVLKHVLSAEGDAWFRPDKLTHVIDVYMNSHLSDGKPYLSNMVKETNPVVFAKGASAAKTFQSNDNKSKQIKCWSCLKVGHRSSECRSKGNVSSSNAFGTRGNVHNGQREKPVIRVNSAAVETDTLAMPLVNINATSVVSRLENDPSLPGYKPILNTPVIGMPCKAQVSAERPIIESVRINASCVARETTTHVQGLHDTNCAPRDVTGLLSQGNNCDYKDNNQTVGASSIPLAQLQYMPIVIKGIDNPIMSLKDTGAEISVIQPKIIQHLNLPHVGRITIRGIVGPSVEADLVMLEIKPYTEKGYTNIIPPIPVIFASCEISSGYDAVVSSSIIEQLDEMRSYDVVTPFSIEPIDVTVGAMVLRSRQLPDLTSPGLDNELSNSDQAEQLVHITENVETVDRRADTDTLKAEQLADETLKPCWLMAKQSKGNFFVKNGLLYHYDRVLGQQVEQLCLPVSRRASVLKLAHDLCHEGYKRTKEKIRLSFYWNNMATQIKQFTSSCFQCQKRSRLLVKDRVPISVIPRDEVPFSHLYMDCIGPLLENAEWNYCLCIIDSATRWPFAFPLRAQTAKAVCECLIQVFSMVGVSSVITSDMGSCFTAQLTTLFLKKLGCTPRFSTPLHPEGNSLVERLNQTLKRMLHHVIRKSPKQWPKMLPYVLWCIRESSNETLGTSPYMMVYGRLPSNSLKVLVENWTKNDDLPFNLGKSTVEFLAELQRSLKSIHEQASTHAQHEQRRYVNHYNLRSRDKQFKVGQLVIVLIPDCNNKLMCQWQGPGTIVEVKSPYSYLVELEDGQTRLLHANKLRAYHSRVNEALVNNCSIVYDIDEDFGSIPVIERHVKDIALPSQRIDLSKVAHLTLDQSRDFLNILDEFADCFSDDPGLCDFGYHEINVSDDFKPKRLRSYKIPELLKPEVERQIQELLDKGFIKPSNSPMASPIVCVLKGKQGSEGVRVCCDFRFVNKFTQGDAYPTPDITDVIHRVGQAKYISTWDAKAGYWQIKIKPEHTYLTAFTTGSNLFEWTRMAFGLKCASNTFIRIVQQILQPIREFNDSYVDDMATYSDSWDLHLTHVRLFLLEIRKSGLTLNLQKCDFAKSEVSFVGHVIGAGYHGPDPEKVATVEHMRAPTTKKGVRKILGFFSYFRTYINGFAEIARPLTELTGKHVPNVVPWSSIHQQAFTSLKNRLCEVTKLHTVEYGKPFGLLVDASATSVGCCLIQWSSDGREKPIAFGSSKLNATQRAWATIEREAYAVIYALRKFKSFIFGAEIVIFSDHNPLTYMNDCAPKSAKLTRWALGLQEFNLHFKFKAGRANTAADCLSRLEEE